MSSTVARPLSLKLCPPRPASMEIERNAVAALLAGSSAGVVLFNAPAGYGKSTVMGQWLRALRASGIPVAWLTADRHDNDPGRFAYHLHAALAPLLPDAAPDAAVGAEVGTGNHAYRLLDSLAVVETPFVLFIDDAEHLDNPEVLATLGHVIDALAPGQRLVIGSRTRPDLPLGRLRARGRLLEVDHLQLRFSVGETHDYLRARPQAALSEADVGRLQQRTDGWPAALQLATALGSSAGIDAVLGARSDFSRDLAAWLVEDVLARLPPERRHFLLQTSLFDSFCAGMCDTVLGREDSAAMLRQIERDNLFLLSLEADGEWHRYHPLFLAFLRSQAGVPSALEAERLHTRAAKWLAQQGRLMPAIQHALAGRQHGLAAELMAVRALEMVNTGQVGTLRRWVEGLADDLLAANPDLAIAGAYAMAIQHRHQAVPRLLDAVGRVAESGSALARELLGVKMATLLWADRMPEAIEMARGHVERIDDAPPRVVRLLHNTAAYDCISRGDYALALRYLATAKRLYVGEIHGLNHTMCLEGTIDLHLGNVREAHHRFEATLATVIERGCRYTDASGVAASHLAEALYERNHLQEVEVLLEEYLPIVRDACIPEHLIAPHRIAVRTHALRGRAEQARQALAAMQDLGDNWGVPRIATAARHEKLRLALLGGDLASARQLLALIEQGGGWKAEAGQYAYSEDLDDSLIASLRVAMRSGAAPSMISRIGEAVAEAEAVQHQRRALRLRCLLAQAHEAAGKRAQAVELMADVVSVAATKGLVRTIADEPWHLEPLLDALARTGGADATHLAAIRAAMQPGTAAAPAAAQSDAARDLLSQRESQVLRLLASGLSNKELGRKLFISENTVETHLRRINDKLGARNRTQAVSRAREMGLV